MFGLSLLEGFCKMRIEIHYNSRIIAALALMLLTVSQNSFAVCDSHRSSWEDQQKECERLSSVSEALANNLGPFGFIGLAFAPSAKEACDSAAISREQYELCVEHEKLAQEYAAQDAKRLAEKAVIEASIAPALNSYFSNVSTMESEYAAAVRELVTAYLLRGIDITDPVIDAEIQGEIKQIEKDSVKNLLNKIKQDLL